MAIILFLFCLGILLNPKFIAASEIPPVPYEKSALHKPDPEIVKKLEQDYAAEQIKLARQKAYKKASYVSYSKRQCVTYAKELTGVYGTWGNGGRRLSLNSSPTVGAVIIFTYVHVAVITAFDGTNITYTDRNYDLRGGIRLEVKTTIRDPKIKGYHKF